MSSDLPPDPYFSGINFNPNFFTTVVQYLTEAVANTKYLRLIGGVLTGNLGIKVTPRTELDVNGKAIIDNNLNAIPTVGILGGNGTKLILTAGTPSAEPFAIGTESGNLWYGVPTTAGHTFYNGPAKVLIINNSGNVGIGFTNITISGGSKLNVTANLTTPNTTFPMRISAGVADTLGTSATLIGLASETALTYTKCAIGHVRTATFDRGHIVFLTNNDATTNSCGISDEKLRITSTGDIRTSTTSTFFSSGSYAYFGASDTSGLRIGKNDIYTNTANTGGITIFTQNTGQAISLGFFGGNGTILTLNNTNATFTQPILVSGASAKIGIGTATTPNNILQVGDGGKLRISNGTTDYTLIGSKDTDDTNNTKIVLGGYQQSGNEGNIKYYCVGATGAHTFYVNTLATFDIDSSDFTIYNSITSVGANYYTDGQYITYSIKNDALGIARAGYFIDTGRFFNSMVALALSHNSTSYTYWHGHVGTNNTTNPIYINLLFGSNMTVESFVEQTTLKPWLRVYPIVAYSTAVQLRVKFYG